MSADGPFAQKARPGLFRLADEDHVGISTEVVLLDRHPGPADDREDPPTLQLGQDLPHPEPLDAHPGHADDVGPGATVEVDRLDVLVDEDDRVALGRQGGEQREGRDGQVRPLPHEGQRVLHAPERYLESGIDQDDVSHAPHLSA